MGKSLLTLTDLTKNEISEIFNLTKKRKDQILRREEIKVLSNKIIGLMFEKPSTRTRAGFEVATLRLGGKAMYLPSSELQLKRGEPIKDAARILGSYLDMLVIRVYEHKTVEQFRDYSGVRVINGLSDLSHPTQGITDLYTIKEVRGELEGQTMAFIGDGNNVCHSLMLASALMGVNLRIACPKGHEPNDAVTKKAKELSSQSGTEISIMEEPKGAAEDADVLYTDVWVSMKREDQLSPTTEDFRGYQINNELLSVAKKDASVMHCLPAVRGEEITDEIIEGRQSIVWQQAANKLYSAVGILEFFNQ